MIIENDELTLHLLMQYEDAERLNEYAEMIDINQKEQ